MPAERTPHADDSLLAWPLAVMTEWLLCAPRTVLACAAGLQGWLGARGLMAQLAVGLLPVAVGVGAYGAAARLLGLRELDAILAAIRRRRPPAGPEA